MPKIKERVYSLDTEATGLDLMHGAKPFFVTMCDIEGNVQYWEADVDPLTRQPEWEHIDLVEIEDLINSADRLVLQNPKFDSRALETIGCMDGGLPWDKVVDTLMAGHLLVSNQPHDLTTMSMIYLRVNIQPLEDKLEVATKEAQKIAKRKYPDWQLARKGREDMPSAKEKTWKYDSWLPRAIAEAEGYPEDHDWWHVLADYGNGDSSVTLPLYLKQEQLLKRQGLWSIYLERLKLLPVIYAMESNGMTMSRSRLEELYGRLTEESEQCRAECIELADGEIEDLPVNGMSNALRHVLFEKFALKSTKLTKGGKESGDKFVLDHWLATLPESSRPYKFVNNLRRYRKRKTAIGYMDSYKKFWLPLNGSSECRVVYPSFNATGTDTLRFSSQNPNAQQISKQEDVNLRYCFGPAPGREWYALDYENLELRIPAYVSGEKVMIDIFEHPDDPPYFGSYHLLNASIVYPDLFWPIADNKGEFKKKYASTYYQWIKNFGFAVGYGAMEKSGTADRAAHKEGAQRMVMNQLKEHTKLNASCIAFAEKHGYIETLPDKTVDPNRGYPLWCSRTGYGRVLPTVPLNYKVQGTAMWITMKAMIRCQTYLMERLKVDGKMVCQVHDELLFDFPRGVGKFHVGNLQKLMEQSGDDVGVPLKVAISSHPISWDN
jgi:DNA polymerase I-like protein with 3'-5' exonuclease and polymerase domains